MEQINNMNTIRRINQINQKELQSNTSYEDSWHYDYRDTSYIHIGNLHPDLKEQDIVIIFSQYGIPTHIKMLKDAANKNKNRGFCFLKYANFQSCALAVDNFSGIKVFERNLKVDHMYFKIRGDENEDDYKVDYGRAIQGKKEERERSEGVLEKAEEIGGYKMIEYKRKSDRTLHKSDRSDKKRDKGERRYKEGGAKKQKKENDDEFLDPMANFSKQSVDDDFQGPMENFSKTTTDNTDDFKDPMQAYLKKD